MYDVCMFVCMCEYVIAIFKQYLTYSPIFFYDKLCIEHSKHLVILKFFEEKSRITSISYLYQNYITHIFGINMPLAFNYQIS